MKRVAIALGLVLVAGIFIGAAPVAAQTFSLDLGDVSGPGSTTARIVQLFLLITVLTLAPAILVMMTSFTRIVVVLSFLRTAMGTQQTPPNQVLTSLALFLTLFIMAPTMEKAYQQSIKPLINEEITEFEAFEKGIAPFREFMMRHVREQDIQLFVDIAGIPDEEVRKEMPIRVLIPAFMISELKRAFEIGFFAVPALPDHRHGGGVRLDVDGYDDAAADHHRAALQDHLLRSGRRLVHDRRQPGAKLRRVENPARPEQPSRCFSIASRHRFAPRRIRRSISSNSEHIPARRRPQHGSRGYSSGPQTRPRRSVH
jgi:flagellar biosynthetic protein FliP